MTNYKIIESGSFYAAVATWILATLFFFRDTSEFFSSAFAALLTAALVWISYVLTRILYFSLRK